MILKAVNGNGIIADKGTDMVKPVKQRSVVLATGMMNKYNELVQRAVLKPLNTDEQSEFFRLLHIIHRALVQKINGDNL